MSNRKAPYLHKDGSNCWTKNCTLGNSNTGDPVKEFFSTSDAPKNKLTRPPMINDIASLDEFEQAAKDGLIDKQRHPLYPYTIYKYSDETQYGKKWNKITLASRGLVVNHETGEIVARPFSKFFNHNEPNVPHDLLKGKIVVAEKLDGSLGLSYDTPDGLQITTTGGFSGEQAAHATELYREKYEGKWKPKKELTYLWEIIYPSNRIVVDYGDEDDIHLLGAVNKYTGKSVPLSDIKEWKWKKAKEHENLETLDNVLTSEERSNHEGYVIHYVETDTRVKYKHAEYVQFHRFATGINSRRIWEMMSSGQDVENLRKTAPEELESYIDETYSKINGQYKEEQKKYDDEYERIQKIVPSDINQKDFALFVQKNVDKKFHGYVFGKKSGRTDFTMHEKTVWQNIKPKFERGLFSMNSFLETEETNS